MRDVPYQPASALPLSSPEPETVSTWRDWIGIVASIGCAIHCAAMPFVIASLPTLGLSFLADESFHQWMALAAGNRNATYEPSIPHGYLHFSSNCSNSAQPDVGLSVMISKRLSRRYAVVRNEVSFLLRLIAHQSSWHRNTPFSRSTGCR